MSEKFEFIIATPQEQTASNKIASATSKARQHAARRYHGQERARRRQLLLEALRIEDDVSVAADSTNLHENTQKDLNRAGDQVVIKDTKSQRIEHAENLSLTTQPEDAFFSQLGLRKRSEKDDVVRYLQVVPAMAMGACRDDLFQPIRDINIRALFESPVVCDWVLLEMEGIRSRFNPMVRDKMSIRRRRIYRTMNKMLADPAARRSDDILNMVFAAACIEYRTADGVDVANVRIHYKGLERLIENRGGLASLWGCAATLGHPICCLAYLHMSELEVSGQNQAQGCCTSFTMNMKHIQTFVTGTGHPMTLSTDTIQLRFPADRSADRTTGKLYPSLKHLVHRECSSEGSAERIAHFLSLYMVALFISDFGHGNPIADRYLSRICALIDDRINTTTGATVLNSHVIVFMVVATWVEIDASNTWQDSGPHKELRMTQAGIDALKVFGRLPDARKDDLTNLLANWICAGCDVGEHIWSGEYCRSLRYVGDDYFDQITSECCSDWYEQHVSCKEILVNY